MPGHRLLATLATVALAGAASAGCGGDPLSREDYSAELVSAVAATSIVPGNLDAPSVASMAEQYEEMGEDLEGVVPPREVAGSHARLVTGLKAYAGRLDAAATALEAQDAATYTQEMALGQESARSWTRAFEDLRARGYGTVTAAG